MHKQLHFNYYEAVIQIRPSKKEVLDFIFNQVRKRKDDVFISKREDFKYGTNLFISSQRFARSLGKKLKDNFNGELKITKSLFKRERHTGKDLYRGTVLFRIKEEEKAYKIE